MMFRCDAQIKTTLIIITHPIAMLSIRAGNDFSRYFFFSKRRGRMSESDEFVLEGMGMSDLEDEEEMLVEDDDYESPKKRVSRAPPPPSKKRERSVEGVDGCEGCERLEDEVIALRAELQKLKKGRTSAPATNANFPLAPRKSVAEDADLLARLATKGIKSQMKWKPTCKAGSAKWSWSGVSSFPGLLNALEMPAKTKLFKMKKIPSSDFNSAMGENITASIRYSELVITSEKVNVRFDSVTGEVTFSGSYGLPMYARPKYMQKL